MALQSFQQLTGANYFFYYGATIFTSVGLADSFVTQIILGAVNFVCTFGGLYIMQRVSPSICFFYLLTYAFSFLQYGRRIPLMLGGVWQSAWLFVFAAAGTAKVPQNNPGIGKCTDVFMLAFQLSSLKMYSNDRQCMLLHLWLRHDLGSVSLSVYYPCEATVHNLNSGVWILVGETFPTRTRAKQGALATASNW